MLGPSAYDRWVTREPEDDFTPWVEAVYDAFSEKFYCQVIDVPLDMRSRFSDSEIENRWLNKLFKNDTDPKTAARIIERVHRLFIKTVFKPRKKR